MVTQGPFWKSVSGMESAIWIPTHVIEHIFHSRPHAKCFIFTITYNVPKNPMRSVQLSLHCFLQIGKADLEKKVIGLRLHSS